MSVKYFITGPVNPVYAVNATYKEARKIKGIRASVYRYAQEHLAYYSKDSKSIWYNDGSNDLQIDLLFKVEGDALKFMAFLEHWYMNNPMLVKYGDITVEGLQRKCVTENDIKPVRWSDYDASETDSPVLSLADYLASPSSASTTTISTIDVASDLTEYQCIEKKEEFILTRTKPYRCHLKPQSKFKGLANEENNHLAFSPVFGWHEHC